MVRGLTLGVALTCPLLTAVVAAEAVTAEQAQEPVPLAHPAEAQELHSGLWVVLGVQSADLLIELAEKANGQTIIQGLTTDSAAYASVRQPWPTRFDSIG